MANHLDLEEQEQLDQLKHFWKQYGNIITWVLIAVLGAYAAWNGYQYWQRNQAMQAAAMYDELERVARQGDMAKVDRAFGDMKERFAGTTYAQQSGLLVAKLNYEAGKVDAAKAALVWVAEKSSDTSYQAIARLRLASILADAKNYPDAMAQLAGTFPAEFAPLVADRKGDILALQGKPQEARAEYERAYKGLDDRSEYRRLVEVKLNALGVDPKPAASVAASGSQPGASSAAAAEVAK
ncbi:MAG: tetratricopeptide repeat protein [Rhodoferax sp.]|nr:tetratricopeptide repeat protein [Rhodoferax sp.]